MPISKRTQPNGFALPAVLAVTGVVTLIFLVAMTALASLTSEANSARARVRFVQRAMTAEAQLAYLAATEPMRNQGLSVNNRRGVVDLSQDFSTPDITGLSVEAVWMDGRPYQLDLDQPLLVRLRDEAGMINMAAMAPDVQAKLLEHLGVEQGQRQSLIARYFDYVDTDDLRQPNGAEGDDYSQTRPANRRLIKPQEYLSVLGVREAISARAWRQVSSELTANPLTAAVNVNTASPSVMSILLDLTQAQAQSIVQSREQAPITSMMELETITGRPFSQNFEMILTFPSGSFVYTLHDTQSPWTYRGRIILSPTALEQPIWMDQIELTEAPKRAVVNIADAPRLPIPPR